MQPGSVAERAASQPGVNPSEVPQDVALLWDALVHDSGADVAIADSTGRLLHAGGGAGLLPFANAGAVGRRLEEVLPAPFAAERSVILQRCLSSMKPIAIETAWKGIPARTVLRPFRCASGESLVLIVCRPMLDPQPPQPGTPEIETIRAQATDAGPLSKLTPREIEVLALIAQGHTTAQIARMLFRSAKTIEAHRLSLGLKLKVRNRVELTRIAMRTGLHRFELPAQSPVSKPTRSAKGVAAVSP